MDAILIIPMFETASKRDPVAVQRGIIVQRGVIVHNGPHHPMATYISSIGHCGINRV